METILIEILDALRGGGCLDEKGLAKIIHRHNKLLAKGERHYAKKRLLPYYLKVKDSDPGRWEGWGVDEALEKQLVQVLQVKPRRTASGVATITVITKPWPCASDCLYCPSDLRMPKSYLSDEPACQRAERNYFDPYLQVASRLRALKHMGHATDKIELIVLGGTWSDYPIGYQVWFASELFRALNDGDAAERNAQERRRLYKKAGMHNQEEDLSDFTAALQREVDDGSLSYNQAVSRIYGSNEAWQAVASAQVADFDVLEAQHAKNESASHRVVGLVIETRPDAISCESLTLIRRLGCTKVQMGIQSLDPAVLAANRRDIAAEEIQESFELLRLFGFKVHAHFMVNLLGSSPEADKRDYRRFVTDARFLPDEVKLYPCALVAGTRLCAHYADRSWRPYSEEELLDVLVADTLATPPFMRISRMIRDISAQDIVAGNKKANLRQMVERRIGESGRPVSEIRYREIRTDVPPVGDLALEVVPYETTATHEYFLQWVAKTGSSTHHAHRIAGFLRLSLPKAGQVDRLQGRLPVGGHEAMIREVHIYGRVAELNTTGEGAQHLGLGRQLVEKACEIAWENGYTKVNVISSVGTRAYYRTLGFRDRGLYQQKEL